MNILVTNSEDESALYFIRETAVLRSQVEYLTTALKDLLEMPEYDGTQATSQVRLRAKNQAKRALKAVNETSSSLPG
jgi:hypothetical protein